MAGREGEITVLKLPPYLSIKVLASSPTGFYQPTCPVWATTRALWCLEGHTTRISATPLIVITNNIHKIRMACQLAANIECSNKGGSINWNSMREMWREVGPSDFFPWSLHNHLTDQQTHITGRWLLFITGHIKDKATLWYLSHVHLRYTSWKRWKLYTQFLLSMSWMFEFPFHPSQCAAIKAVVMLGTQISWSVYLCVHTSFRHLYSTAVLQWYSNTTLHTQHTLHNVCIIHT